MSGFCSKPITNCGGRAWRRLALAIGCRRTRQRRRAPVAKRGLTACAHSGRIFLFAMRLGFSAQADRRRRWPCGRLSRWAACQTDGAPPSCLVVNGTWRRGRPPPETSLLIIRRFRLLCRSPPRRTTLTPCFQCGGHREIFSRTPEAKAANCFRDCRAGGARLPAAASRQEAQESLTPRADVALVECVSMAAPMASSSMQRMR